MQTDYTNFVTSLVITREIWKQVMPLWDDMLLIKKKKGGMICLVLSLSLGKMSPLVLRWNAVA